MALVYSRIETLSILQSQEYLYIKNIIPWYSQLRSNIILFLIKIIPNHVTYFIIKNILRKNIADYVYTGNLDEKDGISQDPEILTKSNE